MKWVWLVAGMLVGISLVLLGSVVFAQPDPFRGSVIDPAVPAPDFSLVDEDHQPYQLSAQEGQVVLLFFGYTHCPDVCPATLGAFKQLREDLGPDADRVEMVLVTTDPERDTPERLTTYIAAFGEGITGLTGSPEDLEHVWHDYGVYVEIQHVGSDHDDYLVDHTSRIYAIDARGNLRLTYTADTPISDILADVQRLLKEK